MKSNDKIIYWIRHGESLSNTSELNSLIIDPSLTPKGISECESLKKYIKSNDIFNDIDLVVVSPLTRTLETCFNVFDELIYKVNFISLDEIREQIDKPCHKRNKISNIKNKYKFIDFSNVINDDIMYLKYKGLEPKSNVISRCKWFVKWLKNRKEKNIVVITHGNFLFPLFNEILKNVSNKAFFINCEMRKYILDNKQI